MSASVTSLTAAAFLPHLARRCRRHARRRTIWQIIQDGTPYRIEPYANIRIIPDPEESKAKSELNESRPTEPGGRRTSSEIASCQLHQGTDPKRFLHV